MLDPIIREYMKQGEVKLHSNINKYFSKDCLFELELLILNNSIDNNSKIVVCDQILEKYKIPFTKLGGGTNRYGILVDGYVFKIALDKDGINEFSSYMNANFTVPIPSDWYRKPLLCWKLLRA